MNVQFLSLFSPTYNTCISGCGKRDVNIKEHSIYENFPRSVLPYIACPRLTVVNRDWNLHC